MSLLNIIYLVFIILASSGVNILKKPYTDKMGGKGVCLFSTMFCVAMVLFFVVISGGLQFEKALLPYCAAFATTSAVAIVFSTIAVLSGPLSLTTLIISYSLMIPTFYGILFLKNPISWTFVVGLVLLVISLLLINKKKETVVFSVKWLVSVILAAVANGMCSVVQNMQQVAFQGGYKNELMVFSMVMAAVVLLIIALWKEKTDLGVCFKNGWLPAAICGCCNSISNLFVMVLTGKMAISLMFPLISSGGIIVTYLVSRFFYKEQLTKLQLAGVAIGIGSIVFLSI